jgi:hypothetical protein
LIKPGHGNLLSVRLSVEMKGDYSQLGLMPGRYLEQFDLPSAYLWPRYRAYPQVSPVTLLTSDPRSQLAAGAASLCCAGKIVLIAVRGIQGKRLTSRTVDEDAQSGIVICFSSRNARSNASASLQPRPQETEPL